ncbi:hypothetical protein BHE74_00026390 [Ensete ventricosum]|nr:hypothetical protein BHE74_00026390 [Ensete ventricosum]
MISSTAFRVHSTTRNTRHVLLRRRVLFEEKLVSADPAQPSHGGARGAEPDPTRRAHTGITEAIDVKSRPFV